jgi:tetratricopeptide (TPR) repeat protein
MSAGPHPGATQKIQQGVAAWERSAYLEALEIFNEVLAEHPLYPDVHHKAGLCQAMLGELEAALASFDRAIELAPGYAEAHFNRAIVLNDLGRHEEAEASFQRAQSLETRDGAPFAAQAGNRIANGHAELGDLYRAAESLPEAVEQYRAALEVRPRYLDVRQKLAEALLALGEVEEARRELERIVAEAPGATEARLRLGVALQRLGDAEGAIREWNAVRAARPGDRRASGYLAAARGGPGTEAQR